MDQQEIDAILKGNFSELEDFNRKQKEISQKFHRSEDPPPRKEGKVIGQLNRVTEEAELGTNMVMNYLENLLTIINKQKNFLKERSSIEAKSPQEDELIKFFEDTTFICEDLIFNAMDAFQFQDINRQKLLKVMHTLTQLNEYLNELLGSDQQKTNFGKNIESSSLFKDEKKEEVDRLIEDFKKQE